MVNSAMNLFLGETLRRLRNSKGLSLEVVAKQIGITSQQLGKYERGENRIAADMIYELVQIYQVSFDSLYPSVFSNSKALKRIYKELQIYPEGMLRKIADLLKENRKFTNKKSLRVSKKEKKRDF